MPNLNRSAEIIAFPPRGRFAAAQEPSDARAASRIVQAVTKVVSGAWYHEEAIREERPKSN